MLMWFDEKNIDWHAQICPGLPILTLLGPQSIVAKTGAFN